MVLLLVSGRIFNHGDCSERCPAASSGSTNFPSSADWSELTSERQTRPCSKAKALAAVRDETPSFAKMFCRWRATVRSLTTSSAAISRLLLQSLPDAEPSPRPLSPAMEIGVGGPPIESSSRDQAPPRARRITRERPPTPAPQCPRRRASGMRTRSEAAPGRPRRAPGALARPRGHGEASIKCSGRRPGPARPSPDVRRDREEGAARLALRTSSSSRQAGTRALRSTDGEHDPT